MAQPSAAEPDKDMLRRLAGTDDSGFLAAAAKLLEDTATAADAECFELGRDAERKYILCHLYRGRQNLELIRRGLEASPPRAGSPTLLDIGTSPLTLLYQQSLPHVCVSTMDLTALFEPRCRRWGVALGTCNLGREPFPFPDASFDMVAITEVMEHLAIAPGRVFLEIRRVLKPDGRLLLSLPNMADLMNRIKFLLGRPVLAPVYRVFRPEEPPELEPDACRVHGLGHVREYTLWEVKDLVRHYGFEVIEARCMDTFRVPPASFGTLKRLAFPFYRLASRLVPNSRTINAVVARKRDLSAPR